MVFMTAGGLDQVLQVLSTGAVFVAAAKLPSRLGVCTFFVASSGNLKIATTTTTGYTCFFERRADWTQDSRAKQSFHQRPTQVVHTKTDITD